MPPKARGRGSTRARGGARGGATVGRDTAAASESTEVATPQPVATTEAPVEPIAPQQEDGDSKPVVTGDEASVTAYLFVHMI